MIGYLSGVLIQKGPNRLIVDVNGVGYEVNVPLSTFYGLGETGCNVSLRVHTRVREDALTLFGFATSLELKVFERLIAISGVGPRLALAVLSGIEPPDLVRAVRSGDVLSLTRIPGIGKKTAERIGLELKDRLPSDIGVDSSAVDTSDEGGDLRADVLSALLNLGYHLPLAERAVVSALKADATNFELTLRQALRELAK
jgi:Holliday junction DNA helicase RuvA